jgi:hypothetical protein
MTQQETISNLKKLNAAYIAALEYDRCPEPKKLKAVVELFDTGIPIKELKQALGENQGRRPDEIAGEMSDLIKTLQP